MAYYYIVSVLLCFLNRMKSKQLISLILIGCSLFLLLMPSTRVDYDHYMSSYDTAFFTQDFPWLQSGYITDLDPLFSAYMASFSLLTPLDYKGFLVANFLICYLIFSHTCSILHVEDRLKKYFMLFTVSSVFITVFYWSPRSSISFYLLLLAVAFLSVRKDTKGILALVGSCLMHSQFLLQAGIILAGALILSNDRITFRNKNITIVILALGLGVAIFLIPMVLPLITSVLSSFSVTTFAAQKANIYLSTISSTGTPRFTAIMSILVLPIIALLFYFNQHKRPLASIGNGSIQSRRFATLMLISVLAGMIINVAFISDATVAGRLSRFSDYSGFIVLLPMYVFYKYGQKACGFLALFLCAVAPMIYRSQYPDYLLFP